MNRGGQEDAERETTLPFVPLIADARLMARSLVVFPLFIGAGCLFGQDQTPSKPKQFIYVLRLVPDERELIPTVPLSRMNFESSMVPRLGFR